MNQNINHKLIAQQLLYKPSVFIPLLDSATPAQAQAQRVAELESFRRNPDNKTVITQLTCRIQAELEQMLQYAHCDDRDIKCIRVWCDYDYTRCGFAIKLCENYADLSHQISCDSSSCANRTLQQALSRMLSRAVKFAQ